jgi:hypothetical protein
MFLRVLTAQLLMLFAIPALVAAQPVVETPAPVEEVVEVVEAPAEEVAETEATATEAETILNYENAVVTE